MRCLKNFDGHEVGDLVDGVMSLYLANLVASGYLEVVVDPWRETPTSTTLK